MPNDARVPKRERTTLYEQPASGEAARKAIESILDEGVFCFVALVGDDGLPYAVPTLYGRDGDAVYLHGGKESHVTKTAVDGTPICVTVALLDGYAFARANIEHHAHYRSVMIFGTPTLVTEVEARRHAMRVIVNHVSSGLFEGTRAPNEEELGEPAIMRLSLDTASAKVSEKLPNDTEPDLASDHWAGTVSFHTSASAKPAPDLKPGIATPDYVPQGPYPRRI
jgi:uncharacterized protein